MQLYSKLFTMPATFGVKDFCDQFNELTDGQVVASWEEDENNNIALGIFGATEADEYTNDSTCDLIEEMIERAKEGSMAQEDVFVPDVLGGYTPTY